MGRNQVLFSTFMELVPVRQFDYLEKISFWCPNKRWMAGITTISRNHYFNSISYISNKNKEKRWHRLPIGNKYWNFCGCSNVNGIWVAFLFSAQLTWNEFCKNAGKDNSDFGISYWNFNRLGISKITEKIQNLNFFIDVRTRFLPD